MPPSSPPGIRKPIAELMEQARVALERSRTLRTRGPTPLAERVMGPGGYADLRAWDARKEQRGGSLPNASST